jgi:hypothetical protein
LSVCGASSEQNLPSLRAPKLSNLEIALQGPILFSGASERLYEKCIAVCAQAMSGKEARCLRQGFLRQYKVILDGLIRVLILAKKNKKIRRWMD